MNMTALLYYEKKTGIGKKKKKKTVNCSLLFAFVAQLQWRCDPPPFCLSFPQEEERKKEICVFISAVADITKKNYHHLIDMQNQNKNFIKLKLSPRMH
mmetsp:Transcript_38908/g.94070  ORF Transcript_38908/g.94070 Transcript_38908/m.94070 type:complete len:98 (+) Transcript_38908:881-1174(+)